jgi:hypothetical protein
MRNRGLLRGSCKAVPYYNINALKGGLQLAAATTRTTREGPQHRDPQDGSSEGTQRGCGRRPGRWPLQKAGSSRGRGHYIKRGAGGSAGGRYRKRAAVTGGRYRNNALGQDAPASGMAIAFWRFQRFTLLRPEAELLT